LFGKKVKCKIEEVEKSKKRVKSVGNFLVCWV